MSNHKAPALPSNQDEISVGLSSDGGSFALKGSEPTQALLDVLSPFTEGLGWVGDRLSDVRRTSAFRAALKAKAMLEKEGIVAGKIPPKILLPWLEGASLEEESADSLTDMWAGLLARAVKSSDAVILSYIETLRRLGKEEAMLLHFFATDTSPPWSIKFFGAFGDEYSTEQNAALQIAINGLDKHLESGELRDILNHFFLQAMGQIVAYSIDLSTVSTTEYFDKNEHAISNMQHLGLIEMRSAKYRSSKHTYNFKWFQISKFAFDLFWACEGIVTGGGPKMLKAKTAEPQNRNPTKA